MFSANLKAAFSNKTFLGVFLFILINIILFAYANTRPISWLQDEISSYRFFWCMDDVEKLTLHTGFTAADFKKPLVSRYTVGAFRPRQVSNLCEMMTFKIGQMWGADFLRDYFLIFLHLLNVFLLGLLVWRLSGNFLLASIAAMLMLNAGASLATMLFPFRIAKILVITFFLSGFNILAASKNRFDQVKLSVLILFCLILLCGFFTDESAVFLFPIYILYLWFYQGREIVFSQRLRKYTLATLGILLTLGTIFYFYSRQFDGNNHWHQAYWHHYAQYFSNLSTIKDLVRSFGFFVQRNFGHWDLTLLGSMALIACLGLLILVFRGKPAAKNKLFALTILLVILSKALLLPHMRVHPYLMPTDTVFPSMLYFPYYYVYVESVLLILVLMFWLFAYQDNWRVLALIMIAVVVISASNVSHAPHSIDSALQFHQLETVERKKLFANIQEFKKVLAQKKRQPVYVSSPVGNDNPVDGRFGFDAEWSVYTAYLLTMFLPQLQQQQVITSLENIPLGGTFFDQNELLKAKSFYDIVTRQSVDLKFLKEHYGLAQSAVHLVAGKNWQEFSQDLDAFNGGDLIFFIKGQSDFILQFGSNSSTMEQTYGQSYQLFWVKVDPQNSDKPLPMLLKVQPRLQEQSSIVIGPLFLKK
ncbi:MAG: hypothetical protein H6753_01490 [Candidatus Omnitrophica bacterium]|nr:hypothetical protein [Candidatus Omnitrophota bacterium]